jgi:methylated-DNA-[protein]-cysteine S-methyltransferase
MAALSQFQKGRQKMTPDSTFYTSMDSPFGSILIAGKSQGLSHINFQVGQYCISPPVSWRFDREAFDETITQLRAYFEGNLYNFDLPLAPEGTSFQQQVWQALQTIPYGERISYTQLAGKIGRDYNAARAVGAANAKNPLPIVIPCHRVIGSNGHLTGYAGGIHIKEALLALERRGREIIHRQQMFAEFQTDLI